MNVTGVQTCALPISRRARSLSAGRGRGGRWPVRRRQWRRIGARAERRRPSDSAGARSGGARRRAAVRRLRRLLRRPAGRSAADAAEAGRPLQGQRLSDRDRAGARDGSRVRRAHRHRRRRERSRDARFDRTDPQSAMTRFLIVRLGALGDIVHALPVAAAIRRSFPAARIDWLVSAKHREILDLVPVIDRRLVIHDRQDAEGGASFLSAIRELRSARYDVALDLQGLIKSAILARSSGAPRVVGFSARYARERIARFFYTEAYDPGRGGLYDPRETRHIAEINLLLLERIGLTVARPEFPIDQVDSAAARQVHSQTGGAYVLINPGAAWPNKRWAPERFAALARAIRERRGVVRES